MSQIWDENVFTIRGRLAHERVDAGYDTVRADVRAQRAVPLWSERLGVRGKADLGEFQPDGPYPVEYKAGHRPHRGAQHAELQLCAQALCLEEMLGAPVPRGAVFYHADRRRHEIVCNEALRQRTLAAIAGVRALLNAQQLPPAPNDARCPNCSLVNACLPWVVGESARLRGLQGALFHPYDHAQEPTKGTVEVEDDL